MLNKINFVSNTKSKSLYVHIYTPQKETYKKQKSKKKALNPYR